MAYSAEFQSPKAKCNHYSVMIFIAYNHLHTVILYCKKMSVMLLFIYKKDKGFLFDSLKPVKQLNKKKIRIQARDQQNQVLKRV